MFEKGAHELETKSLVDYLNVVRRHKWPIISITVLSTVIGILIASSIRPTYLSSARLLVEPETRQLLLSQNPFQQANQTQSFYRTQVELIRSQSLATEIIRKFRLTSHIDYVPDNSSFLQRFLHMDETGDPQKIEKRDALKIEQVLPIFNSLLKVKSGNNSEVIDIAYEGKDAKMTADIVNEVVNLYMSRVDIAQEENNKKTVGWLTENLEVARKKLVESEAKLQSYQDSVQIGDSKDEQTVKSGKLGGITSELLNARTKRAESEIRFRQVSSMPKNIEAYETLQYIMNNPLVERAKQEKNSIQSKVTELNDRYGYKHPKLINAKVELKVAKERVVTEIFKVVDGIKKEYELSVAKEREIGRLYEQLQAEDRSKKGARFDMAKLEREVETNKDLYNILLTRLKEADISRNKGKIIIKVVDRASEPKIPFKPDRKRIISVAFFLGLIGSILLSVLREFSDKTFKTGENLTEVTKLPLLGIFPILNKKELFDSSPERLIVDKPRSTVAEAVNNIRTNLMFGTNDEPPQVLMVTSAVASEGKTTVSCNLGISLARLGPTLVIEADTRRPRMRALFRDQHQKGGLFEYVAGKTKLRDSVRIDPKVKNLYTLPVKMKPAKPIEFLSSRRFAEVIKILRTKFKFIVVDTPPVLPVSDAVALASLVDGAILVVGAESTKHAMTLDALQRLRQVNAPMLGAVLSRANPKTFGSYGSNYYYAYGYGYSSY